MKKKCNHCNKPSIPGLKKRIGLCQYHYNKFMFGETWANIVERKIMRHLNSKQKNALSKWFEQTGETSVSLMEPITYDKIYNMNQYETFDSDADRFMTDLFFEHRLHKENYFSY